MKKIIFLMLVILTATLTLTSCGKKDDNTDTKTKDNGSLTTYVLEAEYTNLDGVSGAGISSDQSGVEMIYGDGTEEQKTLGWSNGYFVGYTYATNCKLTFKFNSSKESTASLALRLGSELGDITLTPDAFEIKLNDQVISYTNLFIEGSSLESTKFFDKYLPADITLKNGENVLTLTVLENKLCNNSKTGGPLIDCIKLDTTASLTWTDKTENPSNRGAI